MPFLFYKQKLKSREKPKVKTKPKRSKPKIATTLVFLLALGAAVAFAAAGTAAAATEAGTTIFVPTDYATIQDAVDAASPGDTVFVWNGTYFDSDGVKIEKDRITLQGEDANTTTIHGRWSAWAVVYVRGDFVNVSGFTVTGSESSSYFGPAGIYVESSNCLLSDNIVNLNYYGIKLYSSSNCTLENNIVNLNDDYGVFLASSNDCVLENNIANSNDDYGVYLLYSNGCVLEENIANSNDDHGIYLESSNGCVLQNNTANLNQGGYHAGNGIYLYRSSDCMLEGNIANSNYYHGIKLEYSSGCNITNNIVDSNDDCGILLEPTSTNIITENNVSNNYYGIYVFQSTDNEIYHNNFINNKKQAYDHRGFNEWDRGVKIGGNYWSDHGCHGNPSNGTEPYEKIETDAGAVDNYPFEDKDGWETPTPPLPDLAISDDDISFVPKSPWEGEVVRLNATVRNLGTANASSVIMKFFADGMQVDGDLVVVFLGAGEEANVSVDWDTTGAGAGEHKISVKVDPDDEIEESSEMNNEASRTISVVEAETTIEITIDKGTYSPNETMKTEICIKNTGKARDVVFGWWLTVPQLGYSSVLAYTPVTLSGGYDECFESQISVGDWGATGFAGIWAAGLFEPGTGEVVDLDTAVWIYKPSAAVAVATVLATEQQQKTPAEITNELATEIECVGLPCKA